MDTSRPKWLKGTKGVPFTGIGSLEAEILSVVWQHDSTTVRDVYETLRTRRPIAYTTVMTVMNNLVKKQLLSQDKSEIAYVYAAAIPGREVALTVLDSVVERLLGGDRRIAVAHMLDLDEDLTDDQFEEMRRSARRRLAS
jgi:predicted transcriptional regulator